MSKVYRFHEPACDTNEVEPFLLSKRKSKASLDSYYLAADEFTITDLDGTRPIEEFENLGSRLAVTLTRYESDLIALANPGKRPPTALEDMHFWLPKRAFVPVSTLGFESLKHIIAKYGPHLTSAHVYCDTVWNTVCNSLRRKTSFDKRFKMAWHLPIQNVFVLEEVRPDRSVIAIDVNAMYSACMQHPIPHPASISKVKFSREYLAGEELLAGLYRCKLNDSRTEFIQKHNPFTTFFCGRRLSASINGEIEVDLNEFEVVYFSRHFARIYIMDAVISNKVIPHPLAKESIRAFSRRNNYQSQGNKPLADREKFLATLLSSCGSRPGSIKRTFSDPKSAMKYLSHTHGILPPADEPKTATNFWINRSRRISMVETSAGINLISLNQDDRSTCFMLNQRIVAHGRIRLLQLMEHVQLLSPDTEICYVNIDSVHFSVPTEQLDGILGRLRIEASEKMGAFKIESVTKHGLWLEPGRYWLYSNKVEKFRNRSIRNGEHPFRDHSLHVAIRQIGDLHIPFKALVRMDRSMSHVRTLHQNKKGFVAQRMIERASTSSFAETLDLLENSRRSDTALRLEAFKNLRRKVSQDGSAASEPS